MRQPGGRAAKHFLLVLGTQRSELEVRPFTSLAQATTEYSTEEADVAAGRDVVLVSVDSVQALQRAHPNYFVDAGAFLDLATEALAIAS